MTQNIPETRIIFLDYLRAVACLLVVFGHIYVVGGNDFKTVGIWVPTVSTFLFGPDPNAANPYAYAANSLTRFTGINVGQLGVAIFFLVSGFVILRAVDRENWKSFLVRRIFRIYPPNVVAVFSIGVVSAAYCLHHHVHDPATLASLFSTSFLADAYTFEFTTNPVAWTLEIEVAFYLLMALLAGKYKYLDRDKLLLAGLGCLVATVLLGQLSNASWFSARTASYLTHFTLLTSDIAFLLIGSMIYRVRLDPRPLTAWLYIASSAVVFYTAEICHSIIENGASLGITTVSGCTALVFFFLAFRLKKAWGWLRPLKWVGDISYSLYLIHVPLGWFLLASLAARGWSIHAAGAVTIAILLLFAWILNIWVEKPSQRVGRTLARRFFAENLKRRLATDTEGSIAAAESRAH